MPKLPGKSLGQAVYCHDLHTNNRQMQAHWGLMN
ncbi:hypothetical protein MPL1032_110070 [Mesorhizobium plurifarium]|uniref:Uncharacterized protein n=1 Tax=Mesorhizobium plurifarium TaxID=69974 RepID=A0A0K2VP88_MESPL|nr:hypothetical protein MPL1032_110070 [Mesorhizobium plurifarium]